MLAILIGSGIFTSAFLLFFIQPLLAKHLLPQFGGSAFVWIASILFFQTGLLLGYLYAYLLAKIPSLRWQAGIHFIVLLTSFYFIPLHLENVVIQNDQWPPITVIMLLSSMVLLPFMLVSASSPLLQHWYCQLKKTDFPYYFYAISNIGSLLGLLGYPFFIEPIIGIKQQSYLWVALYLVYCAICLCCIWTLITVNPQTLVHSRSEKVLFLHVLHWLFLSFLSSALLLAVTQFLSQNIINLPLMWVIPLSLYLISFIVTFAKNSGYDRPFWLGTFIIWLGLTLILIYKEVLNGYDAIFCLLALLYSACMICHGELIRHKPAPTHLTTFYLMIACGGALGSLFVNLIAYVLLGKWWDFYIPLLLLCALIFVFAFQRYRILATLGACLGMVAMTFIILAPTQNRIAEKRSLFGYIQIIEHNPTNNILHARELRHGSTMHGLQFLAPDRERWPTTYYTHNSGVGLAIEYLHKRQKPLNIAVIGLGCGTLASLATPGDHIDFYEVDSHVITFAERYFTFIKKSPATIQIILGDARLSMIKQMFLANFQGYDLIVADAFSGDAIPFHLLTKEAMSLYQHLLKPDGIVAFNTSNTFINLMPVTIQLANNHHLAHWWLQTKSDLRIGQMRSDWALLSADPALSAWLAEQPVKIIPNTNKTVNWTDDYNSILPLIKSNLF